MSSVCGFQWFVNKRMSWVCRLRWFVFSWLWLWWFVNRRLSWVYELRWFVNKRMSWVCGLRYSGQAFLVPDPWAKFSTSYQYRITVTNTNIGRKNYNNLSQIETLENELQKHCHKYKHGETKYRITVTNTNIGRTRLTYNCAHLRSTKESLTIFWVKIIWVNFFWG